MRIIAGQLKSRLFAGLPKGKSRPMSDRIKMAIFNMIGDFSDLTVLDAFAGTGALAFESVSRGAKSATSVEIDGRVFSVLLDNCRKLDLTDRVVCKRMNIISWLKENQGGDYQLIFVDPPYDNLRPHYLQSIVDWSASETRLVITWPYAFKSDIDFLDKKSSKLIQLTNRRYGIVWVGIYQKI